MNQNKPVPASGPGLEFIASAGPAALFRPPAQEIFPGVKSWLNHPYALVLGHRLLRLDVHVPSGAQAPLPVVIYAGGGSWLLVPKNHAPWLPLLDKGYAIVSIEYRLSGEAKFPAQVHDVKAAIRWARANASEFGLDPDRIAGWGCSAGGYLMAMAGATNGLPAYEGAVGEDPDQASTLGCVITHYAPSDPLTMGEDTNSLPGVTQPLGTPTAPEALLLGYLPSDHPEQATEANVAAHVSETTVPFLIMHGDADTKLGIGQSRRLHAALQACGAYSEFHAVSGANHFDPIFERPEVLDTVARFLRRNL